MIHEFAAFPDERVLDEDEEAVDWLECFNRSDAPVSLAGWRLSDDSEDLGKWEFPELTLAPGAYFLVYASGKDRREASGSLHTNFRLGGSGEFLALSRPDGAVVHAFAPQFPRQREGFSYGISSEGDYRYFSEPAPGEANDDPGRCFVADPSFSVAHGFFKKPVQVEIACETPGATIRYTTDGNEPFVGTLFGGARGEVYEGPITIDETTVLRAYATRPGWEPSRIATQTYLFLEGVIRQSPEGEVPSGWPEGSVKGQYFDFGMDPEVVDDPVYAGQMVEALGDLPSISLVMDHRDLTDAGDGIYVNASQDGRSWERPGSLELLHPDGSPGFQINGGFRIRGGFSRSSNNPKHSFRAFFRKEYGDNSLRFPLFQEEGASEFKKLDFRTAQNYAWSLSSSNDARRNTFLREVFARDSQRAMSQPYTRSRYYHLYLNGHYWGLYMSQERSEADYAETYFGGDADDYDVIKVEAGPYTVYATAGSLDAFNELHERVSGTLTDADFHALQGKNELGEPDPSQIQHVDVDNLIDYMMAIFYVGSFDAPLAGTDRANNFYAIRNRVMGGGWTFFCHDTEHSMMSVAENRMGPYPAGRQRQHFNPQYLHQQLMQSDAYRLRFADRVWREFFHGGVFTVESATERWLARQREIDLAIIAESARWGDEHVASPYTKEDWMRETDWILETFIPARTERVFNQMKGVGLTGDLLRPDLRPQGGVLEENAEPAFSISVGTLFNVQPGEIYYTLDGSDPMRPDGSVATQAIAYERNGPGVTLQSSAIVKARLVHEGRWSPLNEAAFTFGGAMATSENLVISEIMYHPPEPAAGEMFADDDAYEFLELWNPGDEAVDLTGARFDAGITFEFPAAQLEPGAYAVLVHTREAFEERYGTDALILGEYGGGEGGSKLANGGEELTLRNLRGEIVSRFRYDDDVENGWPASADGAGHSLVLVDVSEPGKFRASGAILGSPGLTDRDADMSGYAQWKASHGIVDDAADPDGDGLSHSMEYASGSLPFARTDAPLVSIASSRLGDTVVVQALRRRVEDVAIGLESSSNMVTWTLEPDAEALPSEPISDVQESVRWRVGRLESEPVMAFRVRYGIGATVAAGN